MFLQACKYFHLSLIILGYIVLIMKILITLKIQFRLMISHHYLFLYAISNIKIENNKNIKLAIFIYCINISVSVNTAYILKNIKYIVIIDAYTKLFNTFPVTKSFFFLLYYFFLLNRFPTFFPLSYLYICHFTIFFFRFIKCFYNVFIKIEAGILLNPCQLHIALVKMVVCYIFYFLNHVVKYSEEKNSNTCCQHAKCENNRFYCPCHFCLPHKIKDVYPDYM